MLLKNLKLNNIRTYTNEEIVFPDSSIMLSGDIGSGKSSILLAIEFALFGILRGELSGDSLLRKGTNEGSVELSFSIDGKEIIIKRCLKKSVRGIQQTSGYVVEDGIKTEGTAVELKTKILKYLGYPASLLTTSKSLIYRYTVYTPQEEMKRIIQENEEVRLDILRKVFNMDKYKKIKENANIYLMSLKDEILIDQTKVEVLPLKVKNRGELKVGNDKVSLELNEILPKQEQIRLKKKDKIIEINSVEEKIKELNKLKQEFSLNENNLRNSLSKINSNLFKIKDFKIKKEKLQVELTGMKVEDEHELRAKIEALTKSIANLEQKERNVIARTLSLKDKIRDSEKLIGKVADIKFCPTCLQEVNDLHKENVSKEEEKKIKEFNEQLLELIKEKPNTLEKKEMLDQFKQTLSKIELIKYKHKTLSETNLAIQEFEKEIEELKKQNLLLDEKNKSIQEKIKLFVDVEQKYQLVKKEYEVIIDQERIVHGKVTELKTKKESFSANMLKLNEEIKYLETLNCELKSKKSLRNWIKDHFLQLVDLMERHVMLKIQQQFNSQFQEWFNFMLEDENMSARLDEKFSPIVEQNGYEIDFNDLSGGEKTSVALAYRLSLNKVINDLISTVNTKDIIVLDEPTDGFSSGQLDKLKDVLDQLRMKQVVIVSHESKVESFVDNVVRIVKNDGVSRIV